VPNKRNIPAVTSKCPACFGKAVMSSLNMQCSDSICLSEFKIGIEDLPVKGILDLKPEIVADLDHNSMHKYERDELVFTSEMLKILVKMKRRYSLKSTKEAFHMIVYTMSYFSDMIDGPNASPYTGIIQAAEESPEQLTVNPAPNLRGGNLFNFVRKELKSKELAGMLIDNSKRILELKNLAKFYKDLGVKLEEENGIAK